MRVVVSVKPVPAGSTASQAVRYVAQRERDTEREGPAARPLFSAQADRLSFWQAERVLTAGRTPAKDEVLHIAVSFRAADFAALGHDETSRQQALREVSRTAIATIADELHGDELRWVAGIHRNTAHPHLHLLFHRSFTDRESGREQRLSRLPAQMLAQRVGGEDGRINPGSFSQAFAAALDYMQERRHMPQRAETAGKIQTTSSGPPQADRQKSGTAAERWLAMAQRNPSPAGRALMQDVLLRSFAREQAEATVLRAAFRSRSLDDPDYRTPTEQADHLARQSQELRDLYERGAQLRGAVLLIPAEPHELPEAHTEPFLTSPAYAHSRIASADQADEFHSLGRAIAGQTADARTELTVFRYYYDRLREAETQRDHATALAQTFAEMRLLAAEMAKLETRDSVAAVSLVISGEETQLPERAAYRASSPSELPVRPDPDSPRAAGSRSEERDAEMPGRSFNIAARRIVLTDEALRLPAGLTDAATERLITRTIPALDRLLETGRESTSLLAAIDGAMRNPELTMSEREERRLTGAFLKAYVTERLRDPETRALNRSAAFRAAHAGITAAQTPAELSRSAAQLLRDNLQRSHALRLHQSDPARYPQPEMRPLSVRERNLLFFGRAPEHHTTGMRELRYAWGLTRRERTERVQALRAGNLPPSPPLREMLTELAARQTEPAVRHYQAALLNAQMEQPGRLNLRALYEGLPPHERSYLLAQITERKEALARVPSLSHKAAGDSAAHPLTTLNAIPPPRESSSYREYMASMGTLELRLLNEAVRQRHSSSAPPAVGRAEAELSITEARALLPPEAQRRIRYRARQQAWEQLAPPEVFAARPDVQAERVSDAIAQLQEQTQQRARLAHQALLEFISRKADPRSPGRNLPDTIRPQPDTADEQRLKELTEYAARTRTELYRGFASLDLLRRELEQNRVIAVTEREQQNELSPGVEIVQPLRPGSSDTTHIHSVAVGGEAELSRNDTASAREAVGQTQPGWFVASDQVWHFDHLPAAEEPKSGQSAAETRRPEVIREITYGR